MGITMFKAIVIISVTVLVVFIAFMDVVIIQIVRDEDDGKECTKDNSPDRQQDMQTDHT